MAARSARSLVARLHEPVEGASLAAFRALFGLLGVVGIGRYVAYGWVHQLYLKPDHHFSWPGFAWVPVPDGWGMYALFAAAGVGALLVALGLFYRVAAATFFVAFTWIELIDRTYYLNHYYFVSLVALLMVFMPLHRRWSVDAWWRPVLRRQPMPAWPLWTLRAQLGLVYFFAGVAKLKWDWLVRAEPMQTWLAGRTAVPLIGPWLDEAWVAYAMSWAGAAFDLTIAGFLLWRPSRPFAYAAVVVFHVLTWRLFDIGMFPWIMIAATPVFFAPDWPRRLAGRLRGLRDVLGRTAGSGSATAAPAAPYGAAAEAAPLGRDAASDAPRATSTRTSTRTPPSPGGVRRRLVPALLALWFAVQLLLPLRHYAYAGNVLWNEQGFDLAWHVMVMEKAGHAEFEVTDPDTGQSWLVTPSSDLSRYQAERLGSTPAMILEYAHWLDERFRRRGHGDMVVRADAVARLNGRPTRRLVDPTVDLSEQPRAPWGKPWVLPLEGPDREPRNPGDPSKSGRHAEVR